MSFMIVVPGDYGDSSQIPMVAGLIVSKMIRFWKMLKSGVHVMRLVVPDVTRCWFVTKSNFNTDAAPDILIEASFAETVLSLSTGDPFLSKNRVAVA